MILDHFGSSVNPTSKTELQDISSTPMRLWPNIIISIATTFVVATAHADGFIAKCGQTVCTTYKVDVAVDDLQLIDRDDTGVRFANVTGIEKRSPEKAATLRFATNAGIFDPTFRPLGLFIKNGRQIVPLNRSAGTGNFYLQPNGVFYVARKKAFVVKTADYVARHEVTLATQSGPLLLIDGSINPSFKEHSSNKTIRSGVGVRGGGEAYFVISNDPVSFYEFAAFFKEQLRCTNALYLDGSISTMYLPELHRNEKDGDFAALFVVFK